MLETYQREGKVDRLPMVAHRDGCACARPDVARPVLVEGEECLVFVFHDTTEEQRASDELLAANAALAQAGRMARLGAWEDVRGKGLVYWSDVCYDIHGLPPGAPPPHDYVQRFVAPAWRETVRAKFRHCIAPANRMEHGTRNHPCRWPPDLGARTRRTGVAGRHRRRHARCAAGHRRGQALRAAVAPVRRPLLAHLPAHALPHGDDAPRSDGPIIEVNPAWEAMFGFTRDEALGASPSSWASSRAGRSRTRLIDAAQRHRHAQWPTKSRSPRAAAKAHLRCSPCAPPSSMARPCWLFALHDITDRKRSEEQVREREALLSLTLSAANLGLWDWNLHTGMITGDQRWLRPARCCHRRCPGAPPVAPGRTTWSPRMCCRSPPRSRATLPIRATPFDATSASGAAPRKRPLDAQPWARSSL